MSETLTLVEQATLCGNGRCDVPLFDGFTLCATHTSHLARALAEAMGAPLEWRYFESEARLVIAAADAVDPLRSEA